VGDRIEVTTPAGDKISGDVINISSRATTILTNDNIAIIVPNSNLITSTVINWSYTDKRVRFNYVVPIHYKEDPEVVKKILLEVAKENDGVLKTPFPDVLLDKFDESSVKYILRVWTSRYIQKPGVLRSQLYYAIAKKFRENNMRIPYPQLDLHLKDAPGGQEKGSQD
jgi:small-conductance mechanosensitive channel